MKHVSIIYTGNTTTNLTLPYGITAITFICWGAGGCGGYSNGGYSAGGGGGGCAVKTFSSFGNANLEIIPGIGGISTGTTDGGFSKVINLDLLDTADELICYATGGGGVYPDGRTGGTFGYGVVGDFLYSGGTGSDSGITYSGGGGGGAGTTSNGSNGATFNGGTGGSSNGGDGGNGTVSTGNGSNGKDYGGGGGGASEFPLTPTEYFGGNGGNGAVYISYAYKDNVVLCMTSSFSPS
jgi:hypothetical protein